MNNLSLSELEQLIETLVKRTIKKQIAETKADNYQSLLTTFNSWQDSTTDEEIIQGIYSSRNSNIDSF